MKKIHIGVKSLSGYVKIVSMEEYFLDGYLKNMFIRVTVFDVILALIYSNIMCFIYPKYISIFLLGMLLANINFILNGIVLSSFLKNYKSFKGKIYPLVKFAGILLIVFTGYILYRNNILSVILYLSGFCSHFISLILYGISVKNK